MKCSLGISNFLEEASSLSHSIVYLYFFAWIAEEGFLISLCSSLELCIQMLLSFLADGDCRHEIKRCLLLGRKVMTNLDSIWKSRDIILLTNVCLVKAMIFLVVMYGCKSQTIKTAEQRIDAFELWCWKRLLRVPWTARDPTRPS